MERRLSVREKRGMKNRGGGNTSPCRTPPVSSTPLGGCRLGYKTPHVQHHYLRKILGLQHGGPHAVEPVLRPCNPRGAPVVNDVPLSL